MDNLAKGDVISSPTGQLFSVLSTHDPYQHPKHKRGKAATIHSHTTGKAYLVELRQLKGWTLSSDALSMNVSSSESQLAEQGAHPHVEGGVS